MKPLVQFFARYFDFKGRSTRKEFWLAFLWLMVLTVVAMILDAAAFGVSPEGGSSGPLVGVLVLVTVIPSLALSVRRLHDTGKTGWLVLLNLLPLIGAIILIVFWCQRSADGANKYGAGPAVIPAAV